MRKNKHDITTLGHVLSMRWKWAKVIPQFIFFRFIKGLTCRKPPIFICGCGHSGTSILLAILGSHSKIYAIPYESRFAEKPFARILMKLFDFLCVSEGKNRWIEKTPQHIHCIDKLLKLSPSAKIIIVLRDGRDAACSMQDRGGDLEYGITRWVTDNNVGESHWNHPNVYVIKYEDFISDPKESLMPLMEFLDEDYETAILEYYKTPKFYYSGKIKKPPEATDQYQAQLRNWQINQPIFDGRGKWKRMSVEEKDLVKKIAGDMLKKYGYTESAEW